MCTTVTPDTHERDAQMRKQIVVGLFLLVGLAASPGSAEMLLYYDFNDDSDPEAVVDKSGKGNDGEVFNAEYTGDGEGVTGEAGDRAMDLGLFNDDAYVEVTTAIDGAFASLIDTDQVSLTMWILGSEEQPVDQWTFYAGPNRQLGSHTPWSNSEVYFDVAGIAGDACCNDRINTPIDLETFSEEWNHYGFVKDADVTYIYQNGELLIEGFDIRPFEEEIEEFFIGVGPEGDRRSYSGLIDEFAVWDNALSEDDIMDIYNNGISVGGTDVTGDFNNDGVLDLADIDMLTMESASGANNAAFDLTGDGSVNFDDVSMWAKDSTIGNTWIGDANLDGQFDSTDFVKVFTDGKYDTEQAAVWSEGDWNGDGIFNSSDFVAAFTDGGYVAGARAVPEPAGAMLMLLGAALLGRMIRS